MGVEGFGVTEPWHHSGRGRSNSSRSAGLTSAGLSSAPQNADHCSASKTKCVLSATRRSARSRALSTRKLRHGFSEELCGLAQEFVVRGGHAKVQARSLGSPYGLCTRSRRLDTSAIALELVLAEWIVEIDDDFQRVAVATGVAPSPVVLHFAEPMPTTRPRLTITETDELAATLDAAAARWPEVHSRRELLLRLVEEGREVIDRDRDEETARRQAAIRRTSGVLTGAYEPGEVKRLRDDWPA